MEAAGHGDWWGTVGPLAALAVLVAVLFLVWTRLLGPQRLARAVVRGSSAERAAPRGWAARSHLGVLYLKKMRTWWRDPLRTQNIALPAAFSVITALFPLMLDFTGFFPFVGVATALMGAATCANLYGQDGTALWMTLMLPGKEKADVRARQLAWLTVFGPMTLVMTAAGAVLHGDLFLVPWALAANLAALGGGVGLLVWISVVDLVPGPDPHRSKNSPLEHGDVVGQSFLMLLLQHGRRHPRPVPAGPGAPGRQAQRLGGPGVVPRAVHAGSVAVAGDRGHDPDRSGELRRHAGGIPRREPEGEGEGEDGAEGP